MPDLPAISTGAQASLPGREINTVFPDRLPESSDIIGAYLVSESPAAAVYHHQHLPVFLYTHDTGSFAVIDFINPLYFQEMITAAQCA